jgi:hypothetical protein
MNPPEEVISLDRLQIGMYVRLAGWINHPFLFNAFKIRDEKQIAVLRSLGIKEIHYVPSRSDVPALAPVPPEVMAKLAPAAPVVDPAIQVMWQVKQARRARTAQRRSVINQCERHFQKAWARALCCMTSARNGCRARSC